MFICQYCKKEFKNASGLRNHERSCKLNPDRVNIKSPSVNDYQEVYCKFCGKLCFSLNSLINHQRLCKSNPERSLTYYEQTGVSNLPSAQKAWNKGLTKETDDRIRKSAESLHNKYLTGQLVNHQTGKVRTEEEKRKISQSMIENPNSGGLRVGSGRGKKGWYKGFFCDSTYELVYIIYNIDNNIDFKRCNRIYTYTGFDGKTHKYYPDFELIDGSLVEIKGYYSPTVDLKIASVTDRPIKVLYEKDLEYAFNWVKSHYTYKNLFDLYEK